MWQYIDLITHYGTQQQKKDLTRGLALVDRAARQQFQKPFADLDRPHQEEMVAAMAAKEADRKDDLGRFFIYVKRLTIEGYHYTEVGMKQFMGYRGNTAISEFPGCTHPEHQS